MVGTILGGLGLIGGLLSKGAGGAAEGRRKDSEIQSKVDQLKALQAMNQFTAGLSKGKYDIGEQIRTGIRQPSILRFLGRSPHQVARYDPDFLTSGLGKKIGEQLLAPPIQIDPFRPAQINDPRRPGRWENIAGGVGSVLQLLGGVGGLMGGFGDQKDSLGMKSSASPTVLKQLAPLPRMGGIEVDPYTGQPLH
jgi:hypothetical protein